MNFIDKYLSKKTSTLNFKSILIITYGRSGSTLLQGILNSIDGVVIRGENFNMCFHLFQTYQAILQSKVFTGKLSQNPFYGVELLDEVYYLKQTKETIKNLLLGNKRNNQSIRCYGFKEIRYWENLETFDEFLDFLQKVFPNVCFIFNTRQKEDVVKSWINVKLHDKEEENEVFKIINETEKAFFDYIQRKEEISFHISYEDVIGKTEKLKSLFSFLGAKYVEKKVDDVLSLRHSYKPKQVRVQNLPYIPPST